MSDEKSVVIIYSNPLRGDCLTRMLGAELPVRVHGVQSSESLAPVAHGVLVIIDIGHLCVTDSDTIAHIRRVKSSFPEAPVAVICDHVDVTEAVQASSLGLKGLISSSEKFDIVVAAVRLILAGGTYYSDPAQMTQGDRGTRSYGIASPPLEPLPSAEAGTSIAETAQGSPEPFRLTGREAQVLECLQHALSNKGIANQLRLSENTVKMHLRSIMRKLSVKNRTEAALSFSSRNIGVSSKSSAVAARTRVETLRRTPASSEVVLEFRKDRPITRD